MFAFECKEDFLAGYDHGKHAGTLHIADHGIMPGKKFFTWGNGSGGRMWDSMLTDTDGAYLELMVGGYSDNQPDYSWIQPYEVKTIKEFWYPFRDIEGVKNANLDAALNLEVKGDIAKVGLNTTEPRPDAKVVVEAAGKTVFEKAISIAPGTPFIESQAAAGNQTGGRESYALVRRQESDLLPTRAGEDPGDAVARHAAARARANQDERGAGSRRSAPGAILQPGA